MSEFGTAFDRAQADYDAREPESDWHCEEDGHEWKRLPGITEDGTYFYKCQHCGEVVEA